MTETELRESLKGVKEVEAPPFLFAKIEARLNAMRSNQYSNKQVFLFAMGIALVLIINAMVLFEPSRSSSTQFSDSFMDGYVTGKSNQLYHE